MVIIYAREPSFSSTLGPKNTSSFVKTTTTDHVQRPSQCLFPIHVDNNDHDIKRDRSLDWNVSFESYTMN